VYRCIPFKCNHGDVEPVDDDAQHGQDSSPPDEHKVSVPNSLEEHEAGDQDEPDHFRQVPVSHRGVEDEPVLAVDEYEDFQEEVNEHRARTYPSQSDDDVVIGSQVFLVELVAENPVADGSFKDHHGESGEYAGNKEEYRDELRVPERVDLRLGHEEECSQT